MVQSKLNETPRQHADRLHRCGFEYKLACEMACYDPKDSIKRVVPPIIKLIILVLLIAVVFLSAKVLAKESESQIEEAMVACLNGQPFRAGVEYFQCYSLGKL